MWTILQHVWRPVVEILILTVGIYYAFRFVRGTRGAPVVTGFLVVLLALVLVSFLLQLTVLRYLLAAFPCFAVAGELVADRPAVRHAATVASGLGLVALTAAFSRGYYLS